LLLLLLEPFSLLRSLRLPERCLLPELELNRLDELHQLDGLVVAEVEDGGLVGAVLDGADDARDDVVDVCKVSPHLAAVVQRQRLALLDGAREEPGGHVGPAPGPVDGEEAQAHGPQLVNVVVRLGNLFVHKLRRAVQVGRVRHRVRLGEGDLRVEAVDATRRGVRKRGPRGLLDHHLQEGHVALDVVLHVRHGVRQRVAHAGLRGEVDHVREAVLREEVLQQRSVADVAAHDVQREFELQSLGARELVRRRVVGVKVVDAHHSLGLRLPRRQRRHKRGPDETRAARDEDARLRRQLEATAVLLARLVGPGRRLRGANLERPVLPVHVHNDDDERGDEGHGLPEPLHRRHGVAGAVGVGLGPRPSLARRFAGLVYQLVHRARGAL